MVSKIRFFAGLLLILWLTLESKAIKAVEPDSIFLNNEIIRVKGDYYYPPFEFINENGEPDGFNVELFKKLAADLGLNYTLELEPWRKVRKELENSEIDMLLGLMVSEERSKKVKFGIPHSIMTPRNFHPYRCENRPDRSAKRQRNHRSGKRLNARLPSQNKTYR